MIAVRILARRHASPLLVRHRSGSVKMSTACVKPRVSRRTFCGKSGAPKESVKENRSSSRGPVSWASLMFIGLSGGGLVYYYVTMKEEKKIQARERATNVIGKPKLGGQWTLVNENGEAITDASLVKDGHTHALLYFGFTYCPDICPAELIKMKQIIDILDNKIGPKVLPVFITCDPKRDGVKQIKHYIKDFHPRMVGLTGTPQQISKACRAFRVYHSIADQDEEDEDEYLVDHSIVMYLIGQDGMFLDFYTQLTEPDEAADRIINIIAQENEQED